MQNNDEKWPNFCNIWNLLANLEKRFSGKHVEVYISVLILWKTHKGAHSNHIRQKNSTKPHKSDENYQISLMFGISRHILGKHFP